MPNTTPRPSHLSGPVGVNCPTCLARPGYSCRAFTGERRRPHRSRIDKSQGRATVDNEQAPATTQAAV